jgi:APA family basic amino acid/polyamine antiporter
MPAQIAKFRTLGLFGWGIGGLGAVLITLVFSFLCIKTAKVGGPHIYAKMFFGKKIGFFVTWVYWCGAWACNPIIIAVSINYLMSLTGNLSPGIKLVLEILLVISLTLINVRGVRTTGTVEVILTIFKVVPLIIIPIFALPNVNWEHFSEFNTPNISGVNTLIQATIFSFWAFVGLEGGTSPAEVVKNPRRTIPFAIVIGTATVALISIIVTIAAFGIISPSALENEGAPLAKILLILFDGCSFDKLIGGITFIMCCGSLNAWVFFSGQIAKSATVEHMFPRVFSKLNKHGAPGNALWISAIGTIVILFLQKSPLFADKIAKFVDMSVIVYVTLYLMAIIAYIRFMLQSRIKSIPQVIITTLALLFCCFVLFETEIMNFSALIIMLLSGIPVYIFVRKNEKTRNLPI